MKRAAPLACLAILLVAPTAKGEPQWGAALLTGVCGVGERGDAWRDTCWYNGLRADLLLGRSRNADLAAGPYLAVTTAGFDDARLGGGASLLIPVHPYFPFVASVGGYARRDAEWYPGLSASLFFGSRSHNFHSSYSMSGGLVVGIDQDLGRSEANAIIIAAQIDVMLIAIPFIAGASWLRGSPEDE